MVSVIYEPSGSVRCFLFASAYASFQRYGFAKTARRYTQGFALHVWSRPQMLPATKREPRGKLHRKTATNIREHGRNAPGHSNLTMNNAMNPAFINSLMKSPKMLSAEEQKQCGGLV